MRFPFISIDFSSFAYAKMSFITQPRLTPGQVRIRENLTQMDGKAHAYGQCRKVKNHARKASQNTNGQHTQNVL